MELNSHDFERQSDKENPTSDKEGENCYSFPQVSGITVEVDKACQEHASESFDTNIKKKISGKEETRCQPTSNESAKKRKCDSEGDYKIKQLKFQNVDQKDREEKSEKLQNTKSNEWATIGSNQIESSSLKRRKRRDSKISFQGHLPNVTQSINDKSAKDAKPKRAKNKENDNCQRFNEKMPELSKSKSKKTGNTEQEAETLQKGANGEGLLNDCNGPNLQSEESRARNSLIERNNDIIAEVIERERLNISGSYFFIKGDDESKDALSCPSKRKHSHHEDSGRMESSEKDKLQKLNKYEEKHVNLKSNPSNVPDFSPTKTPSRYARSINESNGTNNKSLICTGSEATCSQTNSLNAMEFHAKDLSSYLTTVKEDNHKSSSLRDHREVSKTENASILISQEDESKRENKFTETVESTTKDGNSASLMTAHQKASSNFQAKGTAAYDDKYRLLEEVKTISSKIHDPSAAIDLRINKNKANMENKNEKFLDFFLSYLEYYNLNLMGFGCVRNLMNFTKHLAKQFRVTRSNFQNRAEQSQQSATNNNTDVCTQNLLFGTSKPESPMDSINNKENDRQSRIHSANVQITSTICNVVNECEVKQTIGSTSQVYYTQDKLHACNMPTNHGTSHDDILPPIPSPNMSPDLLKNNFQTFEKAQDISLPSTSQASRNCQSRQFADVQKVEKNNYCLLPSADVSPRPSASVFSFESLNPIIQPSGSDASNIYTTQNRPNVPSISSLQQPTQDSSMQKDFRKIAPERNFIPPQSIHSKDRIYEAQQPPRNVYNIAPQYSQVPGGFSALNEPVMQNDHESNIIGGNFSPYLDPRTITNTHGPPSAVSPLVATSSQCLPSSATGIRAANNTHGLPSSASGSRAIISTHGLPFLAAGPQAATNTYNFSSSDEDIRAATDVFDLPLPVPGPQIINSVPRLRALLRFLLPKRAMGMDPPK